MKSILIIGAGGHCVSVISAALGQYNIVGIIDNSSKEAILGVNIVGNDQELPFFLHKGIEYAFVAIGDNKLRRKLNDNLKELGYKLINIIDRSAIICDSVRFGDGIFVGKGAVINAKSDISDGVIINSGAIIEHECKIGGFTHCAPGSVLCGNVNVGEECHIGANSVIIQNLTITDKTIIGAGSVVIKSLVLPGTYVGNPAYFLRKVAD